MEAWIPITILAAFLQNVRSMLQKQATRTLSGNGAAYTRFLFALPFVWLYLSFLLLDRALLVGTPEDPTIGFFADLVG